MSEREPRRVSSKAEAREDPLADGTLVVRKDVRWEDIDEEGQVLHRADYDQEQNNSSRSIIKVELNRFTQGAVHVNAARIGRLVSKRLVSNCLGTCAWFLLC